jgi:hypothetical protein
MLLGWSVTLKGTPEVFGGSNRGGALLVLAMAVALSGCGNFDFDASTSLFSKPLDVFGSRGGYIYSNLGETRQEHPITVDDLVDANGACPRMAAPAPPPPPASDNPANGAAVSSDMASLLATAVNLGRNTNGDRTAILTFKTGPRPGVYRFVGGRLAEMDRVEVPPPPSEPVKKKIAKKPTKPQQPANSGNKT